VSEAEETGRPTAPMVMYFSRQVPLSRSKVQLVIFMNVAWVAASVVLLLSGWISPNSLGLAFVLFQTMAVAALAELQYTGLRRSAA
jgi:hypothetical protein